jgi:hydrogenase maturation protease
MYKNKIKYSNNTNNPNSPAIKIIGFGNVFMSDDALGIRVIEELEKTGFCSDFKNMEIINGSTSGIDLLFTLKNLDIVIIIDAVDAGQLEGEVVKFKLSEMIDLPCRKVKSFSLHDLSLDEVFAVMKSLRLHPDITIIGIKPKNIMFGDKLSREIECKIPEIITLIRQEVNKYIS